MALKLSERYLLHAVKLLTRLINYIVFALHPACLAQMFADADDTECNLSEIVCVKLKF